jgi:hypothetical protein
MGKKSSLSLYIFTKWKWIVYNRFCRDGIYFDKILVSGYKLFKISQTFYPFNKICSILFQFCKKSDLSPECQKFVKKLFAFDSKEKATKKPIVSFNRVYQKTSKALGVSYTSVHRIKWKWIVYNRFCRDGIYFDKILVSGYKLFKISQTFYPFYKICSILFQWHLLHWIWYCFDDCFTYFVPVFKYCYSGSQKLWTVMRAEVWRFKIWFNPPFQGLLPLIIWCTEV